MSSPNYGSNNQNKIKNLKIHIDKANKVANKKNIIHKKIELWTNDKGNEYAISLLLDESDPTTGNNIIVPSFIASTNPNEKYIHPIAETDNIQNLQHGWNYTLKKLIDNFKKNRYQKDMGEELHSIKLIPFYRGTYCNKELSSEEEQKRHEFEWHI